MALLEHPAAKQSAQEVLFAGGMGVVLLGVSTRWERLQVTKVTKSDCGVTKPLLPAQSRSAQDFQALWRQLSAKKVTTK